MEWQTLFRVLCRLIWKARNEFVFLNSHGNSHLVVSRGLTWARSYHDLDVKMNPLASKNHLLDWTPPNKGWIKLNFDGWCQVLVLLLEGC